MASNFETLKKSLLDKVSKINSYKPSSANYTKPKSFYNSNGLNNNVAKSTSPLSSNNGVAGSNNLANSSANSKQTNNTVNTSLFNNKSKQNNVASTKVNTNTAGSNVNSFNWLVSKNNETNKKVEQLLEENNVNKNVNGNTFKNTNTVNTNAVSNKNTQSNPQPKQNSTASATLQSKGLSKQDLLNKVAKYKQKLASQQQQVIDSNTVKENSKVTSVNVENESVVNLADDFVVNGNTKPLQNNSVNTDDCVNETNTLQNKDDLKPTNVVVNNTENAKSIVDNADNTTVKTEQLATNVGSDTNNANAPLTETLQDTSANLSNNEKNFTVNASVNSVTVKNTSELDFKNDSVKNIDNANNLPNVNVNTTNATAQHATAQHISAKNPAVENPVVESVNATTSVDNINNTTINNESAIKESVANSFSTNQPIASKFKSNECESTKSIANETELNKNLTQNTTQPLNNMVNNKFAEKQINKQPLFSVQNTNGGDSLTSKLPIDDIANTSNKIKHYSVSNNANNNYANNYINENNLKNTNNNTSYSANNDVKLNYYNNAKQPLVDDFSLENIEIGDSAVSYENLQTLKREIAVLEEKLNGNNSAPTEEIKLKSIDNGDEMSSKLDMLELKQTVNTLLEKLSSLSSTPKPAENNSSSLEHAVLLNSLVSGQNKNNNNDTTKDFLAMQSYLNNLSTKLDFSMYANANSNAHNNGNNSNNNGGGSNNSGGTDSSSIIKDLINYKLIKSLSFDDERPSRDRGRDRDSSRDLYFDMNDKMQDMGASLLKNIKDNLGLAKREDMVKISESLDKLALLHENSLTVKSGMVDMLNKLNENTSNIDGKLNRINNMVYSSNNNNEEVDDNLYSINNKLDYILNYLAKKNEEEKQEDHLVTVNTLQDKLAKLENLLLSSGHADEDYDYNEAEVICSEVDDASRPDYLDSLKDVDVKQKNAKLKAVDVQANMEYLQNEINKAVNNSKK